MSSFGMRCPCGRQVSVSGSRAGSEQRCECGRILEVPSLSSLLSSEIIECLETSPQNARPTFVSWEVYRTRQDALRAMGTGRPETYPPLPMLPLVVVKDLGGIACIQYDWECWSTQHGALQRLLPSLVTEFGRDRVLIDFTNQDQVGTASVAPIYALYFLINKIGGRFALCGLNQGLLDFFRWHDRDRLTFPLQ
jgi:hypothetical protein